VSVSEGLAWERVTRGAGQRACLEIVFVPSMSLIGTAECVCVQRPWADALFEAKMCAVRKAFEPPQKTDVLDQLFSAVAWNAAMQPSPRRTPSTPRVQMNSS